MSKRNFVWEIDIPIGQIQRVLIGEIRPPEKGKMCKFGGKNFSYFPALFFFCFDRHAMSWRAKGFF